MHFERFSTTLLVDDVVAVRDFHVRHFGWRVSGDAGWFVAMGHDEQAYELCILDRGHSAVPSGRDATASGLILGYLVRDAHAEAARLREAGVTLETEVIDEVFGQRHFFITDPAGVLIEVVQLIEPDPEWVAQNWSTEPAAG